jgi:hypothetical protein
LDEAGVILPKDVEVHLGISLEQENKAADIEKQKKV